MSTTNTATFTHNGTEFTVEFNGEANTVLPRWSATVGYPSIEAGGPAALDAMRAWLEALPAAGELDRLLLSYTDEYPDVVRRTDQSQP